MIKVTEKKRGNEVSFRYEIFSENGGKYEKEIHLLSTGVKMDGFTYFILYDENFAPISEVFEFLNYTLKRQATNTRVKALEALKFLYYFQAINGKKFEEFRLSDYSLLESFLLGKSSVGLLFEVELCTERCAETYNGYLSTYRKYAEFLNIDTTLLGASHSYYLLETNTTVKKYNTSLKSHTSILPEVPQYISVEDFVHIIHIIRNEYTIREEIIIRLMYEDGLRIGEVLGLTADDVQMENHGNDKIGTVYIRNRLSDNKDQSAKSCYKVTSHRDYHRKEYLTRDYGYQLVFISNELYDLIDEYIEDAHVQARENKKTRYYKSAVADKVDDAIDDDVNYYIFINSQGGRLAGSSWNSILKTIMEKAGLIIDTDKRENNLNHRFRHGFAMYCVQYLKLGLEELRVRMRDKNVASVRPYLQYTLEDMVLVKSIFTDDLYKRIPELKELNRNDEYGR